eukprot:COSAG01_NODE_56924_length_315_cov_1.060185_1_plen_51_part_10
MARYLVASLVAAAGSRLHLRPDRLVTGWVAGCAQVLVWTATGERAFSSGAA